MKVNKSNARKQLKMQENGKCLFFTEQRTKVSVQNGVCPESQSQYAMAHYNT